MSIRVIQLHKRASYEYKYIQDKYALSSNNKSFALADGTTQSFNSELWAEIITSSFVKNPKFKPVELILQFKECVSAYKNTKFDFSINPAKASLERAKQSKGGTATFIGIQFKLDNCIDIISCGDTNLFLHNSNKKIKSFPYSDIESLDANNHFINTEVLLQNNIDESFFKFKTLDYDSNDIIILATDALSRLILKKPSIITELLKIQSFEQLHNFCIKYWDGKVLEEDDITALIIPINKTDSVKLICPPTDFSFPKEKEEEFIPASLVQKSIKPNSAMEMNEIRNQFNGVAKDFYEVKSKLKLHEILLMVTISLLIVNIVMVYLVRPKTSNESSIKPKNNTENIIEKSYDKAIQGLQSEIKSIKEKVTGNTNSDIAKTDDIIETKTSPTTPTKEDAMKKQQELIWAGYDVKDDGIWGEQSEKAWQEYQLKKIKK